MLDVLDRDIEKGLAALAIEKTLLDIGKPTYEKVAKILYLDYHCYVPDCYEHPEYLDETLKKVFGASYFIVVQSIRKQLSEFVYKKPIERFLEVISRATPFVRLPRS